MTLVTTFSTANTAGIDLTAIWAAASNTAGTWGENVQPYPPFAAGTSVEMTGGGKAVYAKLSTGGATGQYYAIVAPATDWTVAVMMSNSVAALGDPVGVWLGNGAALSGDYGWVQVKGKTSVFANTASANVALASTATAGELDDATGTGTKNITGIWLTTANAGSAAVTACELNNPTVGSTN